MFGVALAQQAPDAGTLLQQQPKPPAVPVPRPAAPVIEKPAPKPGAEGPRVFVKAIRITGNKLISEAELVERVRDLIGKEASFEQLRNAALTLVGYYAEKGYIARVFLPPQEIKDGVVEFRVAEGVRGGLNIERKGNRVDEARVRRFIDERLPLRATMDLGTLGEALNILNQQPGIEATSALAPGKDENEVDVTVTAADRPLTSFNLSVNNQGQRATGAVQANASATLANPTGRFDTGSLILSATEGVTYGAADYSVAAGDRGLRLGLRGSALHYRLVQSNFAALQANGTADTVGLTASYPIAARTEFGLNIAGSVDSKRLVDRTVAGETGNRVVRVANAGLNGYSVLNPGTIGGTLSFGATLTAGDADQRNAAALTADRAARNTQGGFAKLSWNLGLQRSLNDNWTLTGNARGQQANKNLDSSERFYLGGITGVRAYPVSEATGDEGWLLNVALMRRLGDKVRVGGFIDTGHITVNHTVPPAGIATPNNYSLSGTGLSLDWLPAAQFIVSAVLATPIGNNPGKDVNGNNIDGSHSNRPRAWLSLAAQF